MNEYNLFGTFLKEKRQQKNMSFRELAKKTGMTHSYLLYIENGIKAPPNDEDLIKLSKALLLDDESKALFFDLASKVKQLKNNKNFSLPVDISSYLCETDSAKRVIRKADKLGYSNEFWNEILQRLEENQK